MLILVLVVRVFLLLVFSPENVHFPRLIFGYLPATASDPAPLVLWAGWEVECVTQESEQLRQRYRFGSP